MKFISHLQYLRRSESKFRFYKNNVRGMDLSLYDNCVMIYLKPELDPIDLGKQKWKMPEKVKNLNCFCKTDCHCPWFQIPVGDRVPSPIRTGPSRILIGVLGHPPSQVLGWHAMAPFYLKPELDPTEKQWEANDDWEDEKTV